MKNPLTPDDWAHLQRIAEQFQRPSSSGPCAEPICSLHPGVDELLAGQRISHLRPVAQVLVAHMVARKVAL